MAFAYGISGCACTGNGGDDESETLSYTGCVEDEAFAMPPSMPVLTDKRITAYCEALPVLELRVERSCSSRLQDTVCLPPCKVVDGQANAHEDDGVVGIAMLRSIPAAKSLPMQKAPEPGVQMMPLLTATAPKPVGLMPGRFHIRFGKLHSAQPLGISFGVDDGTGALVIVADSPHLGLCKGDEIVCVNGVYPESLLELQLMLKKALEIELTWHRTEFTDEIGATTPWHWSSSTVTPDLRHTSMYKSYMRPNADVFSSCLNPPISQVSATDWPEQTLLSCSGPLTLPKGPSIHRVVYIARTSFVQPFFLNICSEKGQQGIDCTLSTTPTTLPDEQSDLRVWSKSTCPSDIMFSREPTLQESAQDLSRAMAAIEAADAAATPVAEPREQTSLRDSDCEQTLPQGALIVCEDLPQYGLHSGDELVAINDKHVLSAEHCNALLETNMLIKLEFRTSGALLMEKVQPVRDAEPLARDNGPVDGKCMGHLLNLAGLLESPAVHHAAPLAKLHSMSL
eukprot:TRINITY_DN11403_c0_g1_i1.p1 TRINITY_DN11403_c0_g1~~TRINITY_DN11403_c0_g1_i1.p1  ORF type:complete len:511 (+),score=62.22 TRINITY_DN11403_c0_g1_i1:139-1671(+)